MNVLKFLFGEQTVTGTNFFLHYEILFLAFSGSELTDKHYTLHLSTFSGFSQPSAGNERTRTSPTWPTSSSARVPVKYCISAIILVVTAASFLN